MIKSGDLNRRRAADRGAVAWLAMVVVPQAHTVPSDFKARLWS